MKVATVVEAVHRHPRHLVLLALVTGLLTGPISPPATLTAATTTALVAIAAATRSATTPATSVTESANPLARGGAPAVGGGPEPSPAVVGGPEPSPAGELDAAGAGTAAGEGGGVVGALPRVAVGRRRAWVRVPVVAVVAAGAVLGGAVVADLRMGALAPARLAGMEGRDVRARVVVLDAFRERARGPAVARGRFVDGPAAGDVAVLRVEAHAGEWPGVGEVVDIAGRVAPLGRYDAYQRRRGAAAAMDVARLAAAGERRGGLLGVVDSARRRAEDGLDRGLPPPRAALLRGMVLGQDEELSETTRTAFERSGLAHVLAVSGQNVMLLATLVLGIGALTGMPLRARLGLALALVAFYVPLTGAGPSIQRAGVMGAAGLVAALAGTPAHRWYALGLAAAATLVANPLAVGEVGWQLSFAAVVALLAVVPRLRGALAHFMPGPVADIAALTIAATLGTAPLMALHFDQVSLAALPANLLAAAAIAPIMWLGMLAAAAAQVAPALATPFNTLNDPLLGFVESVATTTAELPFAVVPVDLTTPAALVPAYLALAAAALAARATWRRVEPRFDPLGPAGNGAAALPGLGGPGVAASVGGRRVRVLASAAAFVAVVVLVSASSTRAPPPPAAGELVVSFLDVGQGDATLLQTDRAAVLVDTGPADGPIVARLHEAGVERLDALVITHAQADHEGAALEVMRAFPPRLVLNGGADWPTGTQKHLPQAIRDAKARSVAARTGQRLDFEGFTFDVLHPPPATTTPTGDPNHHALVAHVRAGDFDLLLPADAESNVTDGLDLPDVEALKVAHHGSEDAGLPDLLERTTPAVAAIEVGRGNPYGHPAPSTLAALTEIGHVLRTDRDGTVRLRVTAAGMRIERTGR